MLSRLFVKNYAIIDETEIEFKNGLNILTGETGAGKSILIGSVNAALGEKVSRDIIRYGADYALIELTFTAVPEKTCEELKERDIYPDDGEILISRKITAAGKSICKINGETVTLEELKNCSSLLLDIHGQNEHHSLLKASSHIKLLDKFAGSENDKLLSEMKNEYELWNKTSKELESALSTDISKDTDSTYLEFAINEIDTAALKEGEDVELEEEFKVLSNSKQIMEALSQSLQLVSDSESGNAGDLIGEAVRFLKKAVQFDEKLSELSDILENASSLIYDFKHNAENYINKPQNSAERFAEVPERLDVINNLKKKYAGINGSIGDVLKFADEAREKLKKLENFDEYLADLKKREEKERNTCLSICEKISALRKKAADMLSVRIGEELKSLNFVAAHFGAKLEKTSRFNATGNDSCEFMISLNPGEPEKPLVKVASGGELSRIMLAIKTVLADKDEIPSLIFDEIDTGISGRTAQKVSEKLGVLAGTHQIICITHLAQIASMADTHFVIEKTNGSSSVKTEIRELSDQDRITELARILGGAEITNTVLENAREMISLANDIKKTRSLKQ
ncbi:MAG: DNA repair protein RecN [Lachnospiraceae bacterium]|nr:DNA repair protein RecN [Lachnospiraceae bacterium]